MNELLLSVYTEFKLIEELGKKKKDKKKKTSLRGYMKLIHMIQSNAL